MIAEKKACNNSIIGKNNRAVIIRGLEWDATLAISRTVEAMKDVDVVPTILCWDKSGKKPKSEIINGLLIKRFLKKVRPHSLALFLWWPFWWFWVFSHLIAGRFAVVCAMDFDCLVPAAVGKYFRSYKLIFDCRDAIGMVFSNAPVPISKIIRFFERLFASVADGLILSQGNISACADYFGRRLCSKLAVAQVLNSPPIDIPKNYCLPSGNPLTINVSGYISPVRGTYIIYDSFKNSKTVTFQIVGDIRYQDIYDKLTSMSNAQCFGRVSFEEAFQLMDRCDLVWLHYDLSLQSVAVSSANKMFEAMALGKPYVTSQGSWMGYVAEKFKIGWSITYGDTVALDDLFRKLNANPSLLVEAGNRARDCFEKHFQWSSQKYNQIQLYKHIIKPESAIKTRIYQGWEHFVGNRLEF